MAENLLDNFNGLELTKIEVFPFKEGQRLGHLRGLATVTFNDALAVRGLRIMDGEYGLLVGYPLDPFYKGEDFRSIVYPTEGTFRQYVEDKVLDEYRKLTE